MFSQFTLTVVSSTFMYSSLMCSKTSKRNSAEWLSVLPDSVQKPSALIVTWVPLQLIRSGMRNTPGSFIGQFWASGSSVTLYSLSTTSQSVESDNCCIHVARPYSNMDTPCGYIICSNTGLTQCHMTYIQALRRIYAGRLRHDLPSRKVWIGTHVCTEGFGCRSLSACANKVSNTTHGGRW